MKTSELKKSVELVKPGLARKELIEQSTNLSFSKGRVFTFNDEVSIIAPLEVSIEGSVPAEPLYSFLGKLNPDSELSIETSDNELKISSGRNRAGIRLEEEIKLPIDEEVSEPEEWFPLPDEFLPALKKVQFTAARSGHIPILTCVNITEEFLQTFDEFRITRANCRIELGDNGEGPLLLNIVAKNLEKLPSYAPIELGFTQNWAHFRNEDGVRYCVRIVDGEYPNLDKFIDVEGTEIELPDDLSEALDWASIITDDTIQYDQEVEVRVKKGTMIVKGQGPDGWAEQELRMKYKGSEFQFKAHPLFLKEMSKIAKKILIGKESMKIEAEGFVHLVAFGE